MRGARERAGTAGRCIEARGHDARATAQVAALFFAFLQRWRRGELAYEYQDGVFDPAAVRTMLESPDPVRTYCNDPLLWGELAGSIQLERLLREGIVSVNAWLATSTKMPA